MKNNNQQINDLVQAWIKKAENDLGFAKTGFEDTEYYDNICLLCQQAVEKYLKAFLIKHKGKLEKQEKIHDLPQLADWCKNFGLDLENLYEELRTLTEFYIPVRYPDVPLVRFEKNDAQEAIDMAERIINEVKEVLNKKS